MCKFSTAIISFCVLITACNTATPENYFDRAVLNSNLLVGFAGTGMQRELQSPSVKLVEGTKDQTTIMKRKEMLDQKIKSVESAYEKIKKLKETADAQDILQASIALYEYALPVYKTEYAQLAKLYDEEAEKDQIRLTEQALVDKYAKGFDDRYNKLIAAGKIYAEKHHIQVNWAN